MKIDNSTCLKSVDKTKFRDQKEFAANLKQKKKTMNLQERTASSYVPGLYDAPGNVYCLVGIARRLCRQLGMNEEFVVAHMNSGDKEHMISVFDEYFRGKLSEHSFKSNT